MAVKPRPTAAQPGGCISLHHIPAHFYRRCPGFPTYPPHTHPHLPVLLLCARRAPALPSAYHCGTLRLRCTPPRTGLPDSPRGTGAGRLFSASTFIHLSRRTARRVAYLRYRHHCLSVRAPYRTTIAGTLPRLQARLPAYSYTARAAVLPRQVSTTSDGFAYHACLSACIPSEHRGKGMEFRAQAAFCTFLTPLFGCHRTYGRLRYTASNTHHNAGATPAQTLPHAHRLPLCRLLLPILFIYALI